MPIAPSKIQSGSTSVGFTVVPKIIAMPKAKGGSSTMLKKIAHTKVQASNLFPWIIFAGNSPGRMNMIGLSSQRISSKVHSRGKYVTYTS